MPEERILDCRGLLGPMPAVKTKRALADMEQGTLLVIVDNEIATRTVSRAAERAGCAVSIQREGPDWHVRVTKGAPAPAASAPSSPAKGTLVFLTSAGLGRGDEALGSILMKAFLYALGESASPPRRVVLSNAAVRLAIEGSDHLDTLRGLAEAGCEILVCGTCLDYFGLADKLAVGRSATMYEVVEALLEAPRLITL